MSMNNWMEDYYNLMFNGDFFDTVLATEMKNEHLPNMLYKYRSIDECEGKSRTIEALKENRLYASPPCKFNDIFECPIEYDYKDLPQWVFKDAFYGIAGYSKDADSFELSYDSLYLLYCEKNQMKQDAFSKTCFEGVLYEAVLKRKNCYTIISFSEVYDNELMWAHYSDCNTGFCIGYDFSSLEPDNPLGYFTLPVKYDDHMSFKFPDSEETWGMTAMHALSTKSSAWSYEKEWRFFYVQSDSGMSYKIEMPKPKVIYAGNKINSRWFGELIQYCELNSILLYRMIPDISNHRLIPENTYLNAK